MSTLKARNIEPATGTDVALGASGDTVTVSGDSLTLDTFKDSGGNTLFTSNGSGTLSSVNSALKGNGPILISTSTVSSAVSSVEFTSGLTSTYDKYMFVFVNMHPGADGKDFLCNFSTNGGTSYGLTKTTSAFVAEQTEGGSSASVVYWGGGDLAQSTNPVALSGATGSDNDQCVSGCLHLYAPSSTTYAKQFNFTTNNASHSDYTRHLFGSGYINTTSAVNAVKFTFQETNIDDGTIKMYGIL